MASPDVIQQFKRKCRNASESIRLSWYAFKCHRKSEAGRDSGLSRQCNCFPSHIWNILPLGYAYARVCLSQIIPQGGLVSGMKSLSLAERTLVLATIRCVPPEFSISHVPPFLYFFFHSCRPIFWVIQYCIFEPAKSFKGYNNSPQSVVSPCEIHTFTVQGKKSMGLFFKNCVA